MLRTLPSFIVLAGMLTAQSRSIADGLTPPAIAPGAPFGVQQLSELETVNPYNGQLSTAIPLLTISGRGEAAYTMYARLSANPWTVSTSATPCPNCPLGDTVHTAIAFNNAISQYNSPYSPGVVYVKHHGRGASAGAICAGEPYYTENFSYVVFERPDGTEVSLWDGTQPGPPGISCGTSPRTNRGPRFRATDGSGITFIADSGSLGDLQDVPNPNNPDTNPISGTLFFPNGVQYSVGSGRINRITDRNGNFIALTYSGSTMILTNVVDSSGRTTAITASTANGFTTSNIVYQGAGGLSRTIRVTRLGPNALSGFYRGNLPAVGSVGNIQFLGQYQDLITKITLPDTRSYDFKYNSFGELAEMKLPTGAYVQYDQLARSAITPYSFPPINRTPNGDRSSIDVCWNAEPIRQRQLLRP